MGFSGKPSKGCLPCRQRRTKCDLALPACRQCIRKNRPCYGYRNEQDMVFRNQTGSVIRKVNRGAVAQPAEPSEDVVPPLDIAALVHHPSRRATLQDEAIMHWLANYNERSFAAAADLVGGFQYIVPIYEADSVRGGPAAEIINACGLAALGNAKNAPDLLHAARVKQVKVLRHLNEQLQDPELAMSDSSLLTCLLLSSFENIMFDGPQSLVTSTAHLQGAFTLARMRGRSQFADDIGHALYVRLRGSMLVLCMLRMEPLPEFFLSHTEDEGLGGDDYEVQFYTLMIRVCRLRAKQKERGFVDEDLAKEAKQLLQDFEDWNPKYPPWAVKPADKALEQGTKVAKDADKAYRIVWHATSWLIQQTGRVLVYEILIAWHRTQNQHFPSSDTEKSLREVMKGQAERGQIVQGGVDYYLSNLKISRATSRGVGAHILMLPLNILSSASSSTGQTFLWIAQTAGRIAEIFSVKQGKMISDVIMMGIRMRSTVATQPPTPDPTPSPEA